MSSWRDAWHGGDAKLIGKSRIQSGRRLPKFASLVEGLVFMSKGDGQQQVLHLLRQFAVLENVGNLLTDRMTDIREFVIQESFNQL